MPHSKRYKHTFHTHNAWELESQKDQQQQRQYEENKIQIYENVTQKWKSHLLVPPVKRANHLSFPNVSFPVITHFI